ncbi:HtaA domain-containing protein [Microbacterium profundi]|uniref:HtaA domain-containing protein n=1 Tax=Microbacterium profundi TaxID=450380 RepID=UPI001F247F41|nr:HtaA domain-containing protein [Microbacterium profundi]MCE7481200.1 HtaA domain-containing protein [Microbacterium profundi]
MTDTGRVELEWGIRKSFVTYVERLPDGSVSATGGAVRDGDVFRLSGRRLVSGGWAFDGVLHFSGYSGVLDVTLEAIRIDGAELSAEVGGTRITLALLAEPSNAAGDDESLRVDAVLFTDDGGAVFGGVYSANTPADPITIRAVGEPTRDTFRARVRTP